MAFFAIVILGGFTCGILSNKFFPHTYDVMIQFMATIALVSSLVLGYSLFFPSMSNLLPGMLGLFLSPLSISFVVGLALCRSYYRAQL